MSKTLKIQWSIGNQCNLKCDYCVPALNSGTNPIPEQDVLTPAFEHLEYVTDSFNEILLELTGGEPTQSFALQNIINKTTKIKFSLVSNGYAEPIWWSKALNNLDKLQLTYHDSADFDHFFEVLSIVKKLQPKILIAIKPDTWNQQYLIYQLLKSLGYDVYLQVLYENFTKGNNRYLAYTQDQWSAYYDSQGINYQDTSIVEKTIEFKRSNSLNDYHGHLCWAGVEQIVIDIFGDVWRGWCMADLSLGNIYQQNVSLDRQPRVCPKRQCRNGFDLEARKSEQSWGFA